jgi:hypothetical protein
MSILGELATSLGRRDEVPNIALAERIAAQKDSGGVTELVENLANRDRNIQADSIKTLYEIGERAPSLIAPHCQSFLGLLHHRNNRLVWGAMHALHAIALERPRELIAALPAILEVADRGSVITRDHAVGILAALASIEPGNERAFSLLLGILEEAPTNQFPSYAEQAAAVARPRDVPRLQACLAARLPALTQPAKRRRVEKVTRQLAKLK